MYRLAEHVTFTNRLIPTAKVEADWSIAGDRMELLIPRYKGPLFDRLLHRLSPPEHRWFRYRLDVAASRFFGLIDGYRTVADLVDIYGERYPEDSAQLEPRLLGLLQVFEQQGFVDLKTI